MIFVGQGCYGVGYMRTCWLVVAKLHRQGYSFSMQVNQCQDEVQQLGESIEVRIKPRNTLDLRDFSN